MTNQINICAIQKTVALTAFLALVFQMIVLVAMPIIAIVQAWSAWMLIARMFAVIVSTAIVMLASVGAVLALEEAIYEDDEDDIEDAEFTTT